VQGGNKRALALDLRDERGREIALRLACGADVFLENYTEGAMERLGLGYDAVAAENPGIVYCSMTGFGSPGPRSATGAYDNVIQAASGIIAQSGGHKPGLSFVDYAAGYAAAFAIAAALHQRTRTGRGTRVDTSMLEVALSLMAPEAAAQQYPVKAERRREAGIVQYDTKCGALMPGAFTPAQYVRLGECLAAEGSDVAELAECRDWTAVWERSEALKPRLAAIFTTRTAEEWVSVLHRADLPAERVATLAEAVAHPQLEHCVDGRVFAVDVVADVGARHDLAHRGRGKGDGVAAQVDPVHRDVLVVVAAW
jgi:crotonobetainyl-CoA:carnitine CoA-transferase CaiB-like acyl-CoA transferase